MLVTTVKAIMTPSPTTIDVNATVEEALAAMRAGGFRHLPVISKGALSGIVSDRDLAHALLSVGRAGPVKDVMTKEPYCVREEHDLEHVSKVMARYKYGCALVVDANGGLVGILTTHDCLRALSAILERLHAKKPG